MKTVQYEKDLIKFDDYPDGLMIYFFYNRKKIDGEWCWIWDDNKLTIGEALKLYPPSKYYWQEITEDL